MPTYDYQCAECGHEFELFQQMSDSVKRKCPECGKNRLKRLIGTGAGIIFKGGGFYETDYRSDSYKKAAAEDKKSSDSSSSDTQSSKDTKKSKPEPANQKKDSAPAKKKDTS
ncbi:MAG: FmdB family transcriptional regulator [Planctomycetes bacterium TMED75]|nr:FmdB family transcriptional regulator [Planctomycetaceae bacterium]OUU95962.1 MAG: FmdB family transcriptional regulator [Planctomycetes bacterium TMED75]